MPEDIRQRLILDVQKTIDDLNKIIGKTEQLGTEVKETGQDGSRAMGDYATALQKAERASRSLEKTINEQERLTNEWRQELVQVEQQQKNVGRGSREYFRLQKAQKDLNRAIKENVRDIKGLRLDKRAIDSNIRDLKRQGKAFDDTRKKTNAFGRAVKNVGRFLLAAFAVDRIISFVRSTVRAIEEYQSAVSELRGITQATDEEIESLTKTAREFAKTSQFTATQVVKAQTELAKLGRTVDQINATTEAVLLLATAAGTDVANAAEVAAQVMNQFGIESEKAGEVTDVLARSFTSSALTIDRFQGAFKQVGTTANTVGASLEETTAAISALVDAGIPAEKAGTDLRNIYIALAEEGLSWNEAQELLLNSTDKLSTATDLFGRRSGAAGIVLAEQAQKIADLTVAYQNAEGAASDLSEAQLDNLKGDRLILASNWEEFILSVEEGTGVVSGFLRKFTQAETEIVKGLKNVTRSVDDVNESYSKGILGRLDEANEESNFFVQQLKYFNLLSDGVGVVAEGEQIVRKLAGATVEITDDLLILNKGTSEEVKNRIDLLTTEQARLQTIFAENDKIVDLEVRKLFLQGDITQKQRDNLLAVRGTLEERRKLLEQIEKENGQYTKQVKITKELLKVEAERVGLGLATAERNATILLDQLRAELSATEKALAAKEAANDADVRGRERLKKRIEEINLEIIRSELQVAQAREDAKREEIALLQRITDKTPAIRAEIIQAQTELVGLSRAVDDLLLKWAEGNITDIALNPNLAGEINFSEGIESETEQIEEAVLGMNERLQVSYREWADRVIEIYNELKDTGITTQEAIAMANKEYSAQILQNTLATASATLSAFGSVFGGIGQLLGESAKQSKELTLFQILLQTAAGIANAVAQAQTIPPPGNVAAVATGIASVLSGIAQARSYLQPTPSFSNPTVQGFAEGTPYLKRAGAPKGRDTIPAMLDEGEAVIPTKRNKEAPGLAAAWISGNLDEWVNSYGFEQRVNNMRVVHVSNNSNTSALDDHRMVNRLSRSVDLQRETLYEIRKFNKFSSRKRAG